MPHKDPEARRDWLRRHRRAKGFAPFGSDEHRAKISESITEHWKTRERRDQSGSNNPNWGGSDASSNGIHTWLRKNVPKVGVCSKCGKEGKTDRAFLHHPAQHTRNVEDYVELCRSCHVRFDQSR